MSAIPPSGGRVVPVAVILACVVSTGTLLATSNPVTSPQPARGPIFVNSLIWTVRWAENDTGDTNWTPQVRGCSNPVEVNATAQYFVCVFNVRPVYPVGEAFSVVGIGAVEPNPPFSFDGWVRVTGEAGPNGENIGVAIGVPAQAGNYTLTGTVLVAGSTS